MKTQGHHANKSRTKITAETSTSATPPTAATPVTPDSPMVPATAVTPASEVALVKVYKPATVGRPCSNSTW